MGAENMTRAPSPAGSPLLGHARPFLRDPLGFLLTAAREHGPIVRLRLGPLTYHLVTSPALVEEVLTARAENYRRDTRSSRNIRLVTGESLLVTEGETWRRQRRMAQPLFHHRRLAALTGLMEATTCEAVEGWQQRWRASQTMDLAAEMNRLAFLVSGRCLFGADLGARAGQMESAFPVLLDELFRRAGQAWSFPLWLPTARHRAFRAALAEVDAIVAELIRQRRGEAGERPDLLSLLLAARDENGAPLSDQELRDHTITFLLAGHETTASTLTWAFCLLDQHPNVAEQLVAELDGAEGTMEALQRLPVLDAVLRETLRLYPAIWIAERRVEAKDELKGCAIPGGSTIVLSAYATHRLPGLWPEPDRFRPERFLGRELPGLAEGYFPFGAGPHVCIGQHFSLLEMKLVLVNVLRHFRVRLRENALPAPMGGITLRPRHAVPVQLERRG